MKRLDFVFFDAGGGHRSAANALKAVIEQQQRPWALRLVNLQEILDPLDIFRKITGLRLQDVYNLLLKKGWTLGSPQLTVAMHAIIRLYHRGQVKLLRKFWAEGRPDLVVSLIPNFNRALWQSLDGRTPMVTILTDFADYPPHFWIERGQEQYFVCGTEKAAAQARELGHPEDRIFRTSGMILRPKFYDPVEVNRAAERAKLGLKPELTTGLVLFGGEGSNVMLDIARRLTAELQMIFICGKNVKLAAKLKALQTKFPMSVQGFTTEIPYFMSLADFFIGKPGPGSISEAVAMGLPVIVERNSWTLPQERYNAEWVRERQVGVVLKSFREVNEGLAQLLTPGDFERYRANARGVQNRAVFEIPEILERLMR
ncbi:MAG TPA: glycosyltransferase [Bryobacteraceae bacterium]|nr:glycosyltransferase [Bryobacteraceae bacterium]